MLNTGISPSADDNGIELEPYYEGFKGEIIRLTDALGEVSQKYLIKGCYEKIGDNAVRVTELPVGMWTLDFKQHLENLADASLLDKKSKTTPTATTTKSKVKSKKKPLVKDYIDMSTDTTVDITVTFQTGDLAKLLDNKHNVGGEECNAVEKTLKLYTTVSIANMHSFNAEEQLTKYESVNDIIFDYFTVRLDKYDERRDYLISKLEKELNVLSNKVRYIRENLDDTIDLRRKSKTEVNDMLQERNYDQINGDEDYHYLVRMPMDSVTVDNVNKLQAKHDDIEAQLLVLTDTTAKQMWLNELNILEEEYMRYKEVREGLLNRDDNVATKKKVRKKRVKKNTHATTNNTTTSTTTTHTNNVPKNEVVILSTSASNNTTTTTSDAKSPVIKRKVVIKKLIKKKKKLAKNKKVSAEDN
jgi:DNA topoisomerase II